MTTDAELLHRYTSSRDEAAFAELARRYLNLVYGAALRRTGGRHSLAEETTQKVFIHLARQAGQLRRHPTLAGWLHRCTRNIAVDAVRAEQSRARLAESLTVMTDESPPGEAAGDWEQLRPAIDDAMDQLKEQDREIMLLRFFQGLTFGEVGARLNLTENNARMRANRALEKLRLHLGKRGITSTATLATVLMAHPSVATPPAFAANVIQSALAAAPAGAAMGGGASLLGIKLAVASLGFVCATGITSVAWLSLSAAPSPAELEALRAENARLTQILSSGTPDSVNAVADTFATQVAQAVGAIGRRLEQRTPPSSGSHRNEGQSTPTATWFTYGWALENGDTAELQKILTYDEAGREAIGRLHAGMPASIRAQYPTPEAFVAFLYAADMLLNPIPARDVMEKFMITEDEPGRAQLLNPAGRPGPALIETREGWKLVVPPQYPQVMAERVIGRNLPASGAN